MFFGLKLDLRCADKIPNCAWSGMEDRRRKSMSFLAHMSIRNRLLMTLVLPLSVLLYFSMSALIDRATLLRETQVLQGLSAFAGITSDFVHESQKERGVTGVFLGSQGKKFVTELPV